MFIVPPAALLLASLVFGQQTYVTRYDAYVGYAFLSSPSVGLFENGVAGQVGFRPRTWCSVGFDYSISAGDLTLTPDLLLDDLRQRLAAQFAALAAAGRLPPGYMLSVKTHSNTQTFALGPQLAYRHWKPVTLFLRPLFAGAIREVASPKPADPIATAVVAQLAPSGSKHDWAGFIGFGGGYDINFSRHFAIRTQADLVYDHLFSDLLKNGRFTVRFSVGPAFNFGRNIAH
jgi:hypothetical protein